MAVTPPKSIANNQRALNLCVYLDADPECIEYKAAEKAGYSPRTSRSKASQILSKPGVRAYINALREERMKSVEADAQYVLKRLIDINESDIGDIFTEDGGFKKLHEWPKIDRQKIKSISMDEYGRPEKVTFVDPATMLNMLGKHTSVKAFAEIVEHQADENLIKALRDGKKRIPDS